MGVCYLQHRTVTGLFRITLTAPKSSHGNVLAEYEFYEYWMAEIRKGMSALVLTFYVLTLITILAVAGKLNNSKITSLNTKSIQFIYTSTVGAQFGIRNFVNCWVLTVLFYLYKNKEFTVSSIFSSYGFPKMKKFKKFSKFAKFRIFLSFWLTIINLVLLIITFPAIKNPGPTHTENITCLYQNVRGLVPFSELGKPIPLLDRNKLNDFQSHVFENKPTVVILSETWLTKDHLNNEIFPNNSYNCFRVDRSTKSHPPDPVNKNKFKTRGGGVLIAVRSDVSIEPKKVSSNCKAEILTVELDCGKKEIVCLTVCYRVGTLGNVNHKEIETHLRKISQQKKYSRHIIIGDFNLTNTAWPEGQSTNNTERLFLDTFNDLGLEQMIHQSTHQGGRILDLLLTNRPSVVSEVSVLGQHTVCQSDHYAISFQCKTKIHKIIKKRKAFNFRKANWNALNRALNGIKWDTCLQHCEPEVAWDRFRKILSDLTNKFIPTVLVKDNNLPPWFDKETFKLHKKKDQLRKKFKETDSADDYERYSNCRKQFKILLNEKMREHVEDESDPGLISKKFWKYLKSTSGGTRIPETVNYGTRFRNNVQGQTELFNDFFADQFCESSKYDIDIDFSNDQDFNINFDFREIRTLLKNINANKAAGPDGIHGRILKQCAASIAYPLSKIFELSYNSGMIPKEWKLANVVPVYKKGSKMSVENYRPISLTSLVMKIFEKSIRNEIMIKCEHLLGRNQHGFLPNKSCCTQLITFTESIAEAMNAATRTDVVYFDFAKAFDSVNHDLILQKLKYRFKIDGTLLKFIVNYLKEREQCVIIGGTKSSTVNVRSGVPQGSILGPLLFVLFIDDMSEEISDGTKIALYADDTKIWRKIINWEDHETLQKDIDALFQ